MNKLPSVTQNIKSILKTKGIKAQVKFSAKESVARVFSKDLSYKEVNELKLALAHLCSGYYDRIFDTYRYSTSDPNVNQAMYIMVENQITENTLEKAYTFSKHFDADYIDMPELYPEAMDLKAPDSCTATVKNQMAALAKGLSAYSEEFADFLSGKKAHLYTPFYFFN